MAWFAGIDATNLERLFAALPELMKEFRGSVAKELETNRREIQHRADEFRMFKEMDQGTDPPPRLQPEYGEPDLAWRLPEAYVEAFKKIA